MQEIELQNGGFQIRGIQELHRPGPSFDLEQASIRNRGITWIMIHMWMNPNALDLDHALAGTGLDLEVSRATSLLIQDKP